MKSKNSKSPSPAKLHALLYALSVLVKRDRPAVRSLPRKIQIVRAYLKSLSRSAEEEETRTLGPFKIASSPEINLAYLIDEIFIKKCYLFAARTETPFIVDGGSNIGVSLLFFKSLYPNASLLAFEPSSRNFRLLKKNVDSNGLHDARLIQAALSDREGEISLFNAGTTLGNLGRERDPSGQAETVKTTRLSPYLDRTVDLLKLDIEGEELKVIEELDAAGKLPMIDQMILEYHEPVGARSSLPRLLSLLEKHSFQYYFMDTNLTNTFKIKKEVHLGLALYLVYACRSKTSENKVDKERAPAL